MKNMLIKSLPFIIGGIIGIVLGINGIGLEYFEDMVVPILLLIPVLILQLISFVISHELSHGFIAEKNGLRFTVLYLGPFTFKRENRKFKRIKGISKQYVFIGRVQIDNMEIINEYDIENSRESWIKAIQAGPLSDLILSIIFIIIAIIFKSKLLFFSTIIVCLLMCIPSYVMGDGKHIKALKSDKIFTDVILYTYSISGNTYVSDESKLFLMDRIIEDLNENDVTKDNLISMVLAAQIIYQVALCDGIRNVPNKLDKIVDMTIENKNLFLKKQIEQTYYKSFINFSIIYEVIINENRQRALEIYNYVKDVKHNMPGEMLDFYRVEHILGINNRKEELLNDNLMNPIFKGCDGIYKMEKKVNEQIIEKSRFI